MELKEIGEGEVKVKEDGEETFDGVSGRSGKKW